MNTSEILPFLAAARMSALLKLENAAYVQRELHNAALPEDLRILAFEVFSAIIRNTHGAFIELFELDDLLLSNTTNDGVFISHVARIIEKLWEGFPEMDKIINAVTEITESDTDYRLTSILLTESGANMLEAFNRAFDAAERLRYNSSRRIL